MAKKAKQKVALVLSGGGARGIAHIGVIEELEKQGFEITSISGTSMGAVIGGVYALGKMEAYKNWLYTLDKRKLFSLIDFTLSTQGLVKGDKLMATIKTFIPDADIANLPIPYAAVAADIVNKNEVVFTSGSVFEAIRASMAIPTVFTPIKTNKGLLIDGGIVNNLPINHVKRTLGDILIAVDVNADVPVDKPIATKADTEIQQPAYQKKIKEVYQQLHILHPAHSEEKFGYFNLINKTLSFMMHHNTQTTLERYLPDVLVNISLHCCSTFDFDKAEEMVETGRYVAAKSLDAYNAWLKQKPR